MISEEKILASTQLTNLSRKRKRLKKYILPFLGLIVILLWIILAITGPLFITPASIDVDVMIRLNPPSKLHFFGTDDLGRDIFSRVILGARLSLPAGIGVVILGGFFGIFYGGIAAYTGSRIEEIMMRIADIVLSFPPLLLAMAIAATLGIGATNAIFAMILVWWPKYARLSRSLVLVERNKEYVQAAHVLGYSGFRTLVRHILPNTFGPIIVLLTLDVGNAIITFAGLSFLGLGVVPPTPEWGAMVSDGRLLINQWWVATFPGIAIFTVVMGFNFLGDGLRDWLDPKQRKR